MFTCYLGLGSNLGNRRENIRRAMRKIGSLKGTRLLKSSAIIRTAPVGGPRAQREFLNAVLKISTRLSPLKLLFCLKSIEEELGRVKSVRFGPRCIDLDILLYSDRVIKSRRLLIPHPRMFKRDFVLRGLSEVICG